MPAVKLVIIKLNAVLIVGEVAAVKDEKQFVAFALVWGPVDGEESAGLAVEADFFVDLAAAGGGGRFTLLDVAAGMSHVFL